MNIYHLDKTRTNAYFKNKVSMDSALITHDGFPRSDVNVMEIRNVRVKIIKLRNDLTVVINELSEKLHSQFQSTEPEKKIDNDLLIPFAKVTEVVDSGPAAQAVCIIAVTNI